MAAIATGLGAMALAASSQAAITILDQDGNPLSTIEKARCGVKGEKGHKSFLAMSEGTGGWELDVYIYDGFWGGLRDDYSLFFGVREVGFDVYGPDNERYSNEFPFPGDPPGAGGAIKFSNDGKRLAIGFYAAPNRDYSRGVAFAGAMKCRYKRKHRP